MTDLVNRLRDRQSMMVWTGTGCTPKQAVFADALCREAAAEIERLRAALELIAAPRRPDGTWNRDRAACQQIAAEALRQALAA